MRALLTRPGDLGPTEEAAWRALQRAGPGTESPFCSLTFARAVGRARPGARVVVLEDGPVTAAFLAFQPGRDGLARPIGWPMNDLHCVVGAPPPEELRRAVHAAGVRGWRFEHAPAAHPSLDGHRYDGTVVHVPVIDLAGGYPAWFAGVGRRGRSPITRSPRRRAALARAAGELTLEWHSSRTGDLGRLFAWKAARYEQTRRLLADPTVWGIVEELSVSDDPACRGKLSVLRAGDTPIAADLGLLGPRGLAGWFAGYDPDHQRFSPGTILFLAVAEAAVDQGVERFDLGYGQHRYKVPLASSTYPVAAGTVWAHRSEALARRAYRRLVYRPLHPGGPAGAVPELAQLPTAS